MYRVTIYKFTKFLYQKITLAHKYIKDNIMKFLDIHYFIGYINAFTTNIVIGRYKKFLILLDVLE